MGYSLGWLLGVLLGMRHALEPDHLAAVSTLVASERSARRGALLGMYWGIGDRRDLDGGGHRLGRAARAHARRWLSRATHALVAG